MFMQKIELPRVTCDLFGVKSGFYGSGNGGHITGDKPRAATEDEARAYADFIRRKNGLPDLGTPALQHTGYCRGQAPGQHFHYRGATFGQHLGGGEYEAGAFSVLFPGANTMRATVTMETLDDAGEVVSSQTMPVEPKKGGVVWSREDVRKACGPVAKAKAARKAPTRIKRGATVDKRRRLTLKAMNLRAMLRDERAMSDARLAEIVELQRQLAEARQKPEEPAARPDASATAPDAILSDLAAAEALMRGEGYVAPRPLSMREAFSALYRIARRDGLKDADLLDAACDLTGEPHETFKCPRACRLHTAVTRAIQAPEPMRERLARQVLNCWGHGNPFRSPAMGSPRFRAWRANVSRADALRKRLADAGRLEYDAGNWVVRVLPLPVTPEEAPTAIHAGKRTPAHERAIRRAWAERKARRSADVHLRIGTAQYEHVKGELERVKALEACTRSLASEMSEESAKRMRAVEDRARLAEQEAAEALAAREDLKRMLAAVEQRLAAAEAENAQLWAEIETLTAPAQALAA